VHSVLDGQSGAPDAAAKLEKQLIEITGFHPAPPRTADNDGKGVEAALLEEGRPGHYGLPGMRERARQMGAEFTMWSGVGTGTEIEVSIPGSIAYRGRPRPRFRWSRKKA
jgi:signal transduction histidine kinase